MTESLQNQQQSRIDKIEKEYERIQDGYCEKFLSNSHDDHRL